MQLKVQRIAWFISLAVSLMILFTRCENPPTVQPIGDLTISGQITRSGSGVANVDVKLSGQDSASVSTDSTGAYSFQNLGDGLYRVAPVKSGFSFSPGAHNLQLTSSAVSGQDFVMSPAGAQLILIKNTLDFGLLITGNNKSLNLGISNLGSVTLNISKLEFSSTVFSSTVTSLNIAPDSLTYIPVKFNPTVAGGYQATLTLTTSDSANKKVTVALIGSALEAGNAKIEAQPSSLAFGPVRRGSSSSLKLSLKNTGTDNLNITAITSSDSSYRPSLTAATVSAGQNVELLVTFSPSDTLQHNATLTVTSDASNQKAFAVPLTGSGFTSALSGIQVDPVSLDFGRVFLDSTVQRQFKVTNVGKDTLLITAFQFANSQFSAVFGGEMLPPGANRTYQVSCGAKVTGLIQSVLTIYNSDPYQTRLEVPLRANITATPPTSIRLNPSSLTFGQVQSGQTLRKWLYVVNPTAIPIAAGQISVSKTVFRVFTDTLTVAAFDSTRLEVEFAPQSTGAVSAVLSMRTNVLGQDTVSVSLSGEGTAPPSPAMQLSQNSLDFGSVVAGVAATAGLTIANRGVGELSIFSLSTSQSVFTSSVNSMKISAGSSGDVLLVFSPDKVGLFRGTLTISSNDPANPSKVINLTGAGVDTTSRVALMTLSTRNLNVGNSLVQLSATGFFEIGNVGKDTLKVTGISPTRSEFKVQPNHLNVAPGGKQSVTVTFTPLVAGEAAAALVILSNDLLRPVDSLNVSGMGMNVDSTIITSREIFIPGGVFMMGKAGEVEPVRRITLSSFYMDAYEVTNQEYKEFMDAGGYNRKELWTDEGWQWRQTSNEQNFNPADPRPMNWGSGDAPWQSDAYSNQANTPVVGINWYEAWAYARYRGKYLPTEAQWEYSTRGQIGRIYPWGDVWDGSLTNHGQSRSPYFDESDGYRYCAPIGEFPAGNSPEGVNNLSGNVMEWISDWNGDYNPEQTFNPAGSVTGTEKVIRGGSWRGSTLFSRGFHRNRSAPKLRYPDCGIRLVRNF